MAERGLIVDDDDIVRESLSAVLQNRGFAFQQAADREQALQRLGEQEFDVVITDLKMPKINGIELLKSIKDQRPETIVILITSYASAETAVNAMKEGAYDYIEKANIHDELRKVVRTALMDKGLITDVSVEKIM